jgi:FkbM family methyltransferase
MPRFGFRLVRAWPKTISYERKGEKEGLSLAMVAAGGVEQAVALRPGTSDWMTFDQIFIDEDYDLRPLTRYSDIEGEYRSIVAAGKTPLIIDLGANAGFSAVYFKLVWPEAAIVAVEPDPENFALLERNTRALADVRCVHAGVASRSGTLAILDPGADKNAIRTTSSPADRGKQVPAITIAEILRDHAGPHNQPFLVKIDIEGAESALFDGATEWIDAFPLIIIELHDWLFPGERTSRSFLQTISALDRDFVYLDENVFSIRNSRRPATGPSEG